jgi:probable F420-dependent oxidoreductase
VTGPCAWPGTARRVPTPTSSCPTTPVTPATSSAPGTLLAPEQTVIISTDAGHARAVGRDFVANPYLGLRNYVNNLLRHGFSPADIADRGSDTLIDALVLHGTPETIAAGLTAHLEAGADHVGVQVLAGPGHDPMPGYRQLAKALL